MFIPDIGLELCYFLSFHKPTFGRRIIMLRALLIANFSGLGREREEWLENNKNADWSSRHQSEVQWHKWEYKENVIKKRDAIIICGFVRRSTSRLFNLMFESKHTYFFIYSFEAGIADPINALNEEMYI